MNNHSDDNHTCSSGNDPYSLYTAVRIWCAAEVDVTSDERTKVDIAHSGPMHDLALVNKLHVVNFTYKDNVAKGSGHIKGFLAQEVEQVMPSAITKNTGVLPDIYQKAVGVAYNAIAKTLTLTLLHPVSVKEGDTVKLITDKGDEYTKVASVDGNRLIITNWQYNPDCAYHAQACRTQMTDEQRLAIIDRAANHIDENYADL